MLFFSFPSIYFLIEFFLCRLIAHPLYRLSITSDMTGRRHTYMSAHRKKCSFPSVHRRRQKAVCLSVYPNRQLDKREKVNPNRHIMLLETPPLGWEEKDGHPLGKQPTGPLKVCWEGLTRVQPHLSVHRPHRSFHLPHSASLQFSLSDPFLFTPFTLIKVPPFEVFSHDFAF